MIAQKKNELLLEIYLLLLAGVILFWFVRWGGDLPQVFQNIDLFYILSVIGAYALSHVFRMMRLAMLSLDQRNQILPLVSCHAVTALPSSMLPFKIGEIIRLGSFFYVLKTRKALAIWLAERFVDISVISLFILILYFFNIDVPKQLRTIFILFFVFSLLALMAFFAVSKVFIYLNRYLVLASSSKHGLQLLKISHHLRQLEDAIFRSFEGRFASVFLLSVFIWLAEIAGMALFLKSLNTDFKAISHYFLAGLSGVFYESTAKVSYDIYQDVVLILLAIIFGLIVFVGKRLSR